MKRTIAGFTLLGLFALFAVGCAGGTRHHKAAMPDPKTFNAHFGDMDASGDDRVVWEEFSAYFPKTEPTVFQALDLNQDGAVDHDEWHEFKKAHGLQHVE